MLYLFLTLFAVFLLLGGLCAFSKVINLRISVCCVGIAVLSLFGLFLSALAFKLNFPTIILSTALPEVLLAFGVDNISALFLAVLFGISFLTAVYAAGNLGMQKRLESGFAFLPLLIASIGLVFISRDGLSFLFSWELMSLFAFFLVAAEHESPNARDAAWLFLIATHIASAFIFIFFAVMYANSGSLLFSSFAPCAAGCASMLFICAVIGFGTKSGIWPFHVWMPYAYHAAPSYFSAFMSGVMANTGIYGLVRFILLLDRVELWWGLLLMVAGIISGVLGAMQSVAQPNLKKLFAYSSVENMGIVAAGLGLGLVGRALNNDILILTGFAGALIHMLSHSIIKPLLFFCSGSLLHSVQTLEIDSLGGLFKTQRTTGAFFLVGALAIAGLPPLCGFIGELVIFIGLFSAIQSLSGFVLLAVLFAIIGLAFAAALAFVAFTKAFGAGFLGKARGKPSEETKAATIPVAMTAVSLSLALMAIAMGLFPQAALSIVYPVVSSLSESSGLNFSWLHGILGSVSISYVLILSAFAFFLLCYRIIFRGFRVEKSVTWDCGFESEVARIEYSGSSYVEPVTSFFRPLMGLSLRYEPKDNFNRRITACHENIEDPVERSFFTPVFGAFETFVAFVRRGQRRTIQSYLTLMFIALLALLIWEVWIGF